MRILLTGATGFLGKHVLKLLIADDRVQSVFVVSRQRKSHPSPKVRFINADLSSLDAQQKIDGEYDAIVHLAGLYDFSKDIATNYIQNVTPALTVVQLLERLNRFRRVPLYYASTYAVGMGRSEPLPEAPLAELPSKDSPYAFTKAVAERVFTDSTSPCFIFRLGILVGSDENGEIEKIDGPYELIRQLKSAAALPGAKALRKVPLPGKADGFVPLVPVNRAAQVFHEALFSLELHKMDRAVFGVCNSKSVSYETLCGHCVPRHFPRAQAVFISELPRQDGLLSGSILPKEGVLRKKAEIFRYSLNPIRMENSSFESVFHQRKIPAFESYLHLFFTGYDRFVKEEANG